MPTVPLLSLTLLLLTALSASAATYYVDADGGDDGASGESPAAAFATIQRAADAMAPGDVCLVAGGVYRERVVVATDDLTFRPLDDAPVVVTATRVAEGWTASGNGVYYTTLAGDRAVRQVFYDRAEVGIARFPNDASGELLAPTVGSADAIADGGGGAYTLTDDAIAESGVDWAGARMWFLPGKEWVSVSRPITSHAGADIGFEIDREATDTEDAYTPHVGMRYYLYGALAALDAPGEWFYDAATRRLYLYPPDGGDPSAGLAEVRTDDYAFLVEPGVSGVTVSGLHFYAGSVKLAGTDGTLDACRFSYVAPWFESGEGWNRGGFEAPAFTESASGLGVTLAGARNAVTNSEIAYSWGDGISLLGADHRVENCLIREVDATGTHCSGIATAGGGHQIRWNTIAGAGRAGVVHNLSSDIVIEHNDISDFGRLTNDVGGTNCYRTFSDRDADSEIAYNWIHDSGGGDFTVTRDLRFGVYIDRASRGFDIHHNVVWDVSHAGIATNRPTTNNLIYHNTLWNVRYAMSSVGEPYSTEYQTVVNNLSNTSRFEGSRLEANLATPDGGFVDAAAGDFRLREDSPARDTYGPLYTFLNGGFENGLSEWSIPGAEERTVTELARSGEYSVLVTERKAQWAGPRQDLSRLVEQHGAGTYGIEAWVRTRPGETTTALLRAVSGDRGAVASAKAEIVGDAWTRVALDVDVEAGDPLGLELMTDPASATPDVDLYVDDCDVTTPEGSAPAGEGAVLDARFNGDVADGRPDAGAYEYGGEEWVAGASVSPSNVGEWFGTRAEVEYAAAEEVYTDGFADGWADWSWGGAATSVASPVQVGARAYAFDFAGRGGVSFRHPTGRSGADLVGLEFWARTDAGAVDLTVVGSDDDTSGDPFAGKAVALGPTYERYLVTAAELGGFDEYRRLSLRHGGGAATVYLDEVRLVYAESLAARGATATAPGLSVWPNPSDGSATAVVSVSADAPAARLDLIDATGRAVATRSVTLVSGENRVALDYADAVAPGIYHLVVSGTGAARTPVARVAIR